MRQDGADNLHFVLEAFDEQRADRAVDQARNQGFLFRRAAFALEVTAGDLAGGEGLFLIVDGQREEVLTGLRLAGVNDGGQNGGLTVGGQHSRVGLTGNAARFQSELATSPIDGFSFDIKHVFSFIRLRNSPMPFGRWPLNV